MAGLGDRVTAATNQRHHLVTLPRPRRSNGIQVARRGHIGSRPLILHHDWSRLGPLNPLLRVTGDTKSGELSVQGSHRCAMDTPVTARGARGLRL